VTVRRPVGIVRGTVLRLAVPMLAAVAIVACGGSDRAAPATPHEVVTVAVARPTAVGPDALLLRVARAGGVVRVVRFAHPDSEIWTSTAKAPSIARVLAFDDNEGSVAVVDAKGALRRIGLRSGDVSPPPTIKVTGLASVDGSAVYGVTADGAVARLLTTDATPWTFHPPDAAREVAPRADGTVIVVTATAAGGSGLYHLRPPESRILDSADLPAAERLVRSQLGDRLYLIGGTSINGVGGRAMTPFPPITFPRRIQAVAATPSGDRLYVALDSTTGLQVIDRYNPQATAIVDLPGAAISLRMDPLGRYLLARPASGDSAWIVAVGTDRVTGTVATSWTADLPFVGADGTIAANVYPDVAFVDSTGTALRTVANGAKDFWIAIQWNGFRPRAPGLDQPVTFPGGGAADSTDTIAELILKSERDSTNRSSRPNVAAPLPSTVTDTAHGAIATRVPPSPQSGGSAGYVVQFASVLNPSSARSTADRISANGLKPRVVPSVEAGTTVYHVVLGPFPTRAAADAAGRAAHQQYWIYQGAP